MAQLHDTIVFRGGVTASRLEYETSSCLIEVDTEKNLNIRFSMSAAGGGETSVLLKIGHSDIEIVLKELAEGIPQLAGVLCDCASVAAKRNLVKLEHSRVALEDRRARIEEISSSLAGIKGNLFNVFGQIAVEPSENPDPSYQHFCEILSCLNSLSR